MAVRNFWIEAVVDGRATTLQVGTRTRDGGFDLNIYQRNRGQIKKALAVRGIAHDDALILEAYGPNGDRITFKTDR